jgi:hypothetical protein
MLNGYILSLYNGNTPFEASDLLPPPVSGPAENSLAHTWHLGNRTAMTFWIKWALKAICKYPNNIYYGQSSGDGARTRVDVPTGAREDDQLERDAKGASLLRLVIGGR